MEQCEIATQVKGLDCCASHSDPTRCYQGLRLEAALEKFRIPIAPVEASPERRPIDPLSVIRELGQGHLVVFRWARVEGKANHVNIATGFTQ